jgi:hypothetical protein
LKIHAWINWTLKFIFYNLITKVIATCVTLGGNLSRKNTIYSIRFVPCIKGGEREQTSFLSFFNVRTKGVSLLQCEDVEIKQIGSKASPDQTTFDLPPPTHSMIFL